MHSSRRTQMDTSSRIIRSLSVSNNRQEQQQQQQQQQFIIILTNNPEMIRRTRNFRPQTQSQRTQMTSSTSTNSIAHRAANNNENTGQNGYTYQNHREQILNSLLRVELSEAMRHYLARTHRSFPIHYVFDMSDVELFTPPTPQPQPQQQQQQQS